MSGMPIPTDLMQGRTGRNNSIATTQFGINRPETELMLACASTHLDADRTARVKALLQGEFDWTYLTRAALAHRVMPLLYRSLNTAWSRNRSASRIEAAPVPLLRQRGT